MLKSILRLVGMILFLKTSGSVVAYFLCKSRFLVKVRAMKKSMTRFSPQILASRKLIQVS